MRGLFSYAYLMLALVLLGGCDKAQVAAPNWPLKHVFGKDAAILNLGDQAVAEICPDNNCFRFVMNGDKSLDVVHDFAYLYLWQVESFDLATRQDAKGERFVGAILNKRKGNCSGADEDAIARCTLARMWASYKITGMERKFENGWNQTRPLDIAARLKQAGIIQ
jgi:hypothetical protein